MALAREGITMTGSFHLEPIDENDPLAGYRGVVDLTGLIDRPEFAQAMVEEGLPTDAETVLALLEAEQAAVASLLWEGWNVSVPEGIVDTPWPDLEKATLMGGTLSGRPTASQEQLARRMIEQGTPHTRSQIEAFFVAQQQVTIRLLREGYRIEHALGYLSPIIEGLFDHPDDDYDPERHSLDVRFEQGSDVKDWLAGYREVERRGLSGPPRPLLSGYEDVNEGLTNDGLCPGHAVRLYGHWLRFRRSDPRQGVFLVAEDGRTRREEAVTFVGLSQATFTLWRDLPPGSYWLEVRAVLLPRDGLQRGTWPEPIPVVRDRRNLKRTDP
jgi:hypothetical protein